MTLLDELKTARDREAARRPSVSPPALAAWSEAISIVERHVARRASLRDRLVVAWCRISRSHVIEPWIHLADLEKPFSDRGHSGCVVCTWCVECGELLGREEVGPI